MLKRFVLQEPVRGDARSSARMTIGRMVAALCSFALCAFHPAAAQPVAGSAESTATLRSAPKGRSAPSSTFAPYCGLHCLYAVAKLYGRPVAFETLIKPRYIDSREGSSLAALRTAAEDLGLYAAVLHNLSARELRASRYPVVLHVKTSEESKRYNHFVLFLRPDKGQAMVFDPPKPPELLPFVSLGRLSDGNGLVLSAEPLQLGPMLRASRALFLLVFALTISGVAVFHGLRRPWRPLLERFSRRQWWAISVFQGALIACLAALAGFLFSFGNPGGILAFPRTADAIVGGHAADFVARISAAKAMKMHRAGATFIDARVPEDFKRGHVAGAINLSAFSRPEQIGEAKNRIPADGSPIIVYCKSSGCPYAARVAGVLWNDGYRNLRIFTAGWDGWPGPRR